MRLTSQLEPREASLCCVDGFATNLQPGAATSPKKRPHRDCRVSPISTAAQSKRYTPAHGPRRVRAGSYPKGREFKSRPRYHLETSCRTGGFLTSRYFLGVRTGGSSAAVLPAGIDDIDRSDRQPPNADTAQSVKVRCRSGSVWRDACLECLDHWCRLPGTSFPEFERVCFCFFAWVAACESESILDQHSGRRTVLRFHTAADRSDKWLGSGPVNESGYEF